MIVFGLASSACRRGPEVYVVQSRTAPAGQPALSGAEGRVAAATLARCDGGWCETLAIGASADAAQALATLRPSVERCTEIVWSRPITGDPCYPMASIARAGASTVPGAEPSVLFGYSATSRVAPWSWS